MNQPIRMVGISKRFGSVQALQGVDLKVEPGTLHALVGENGAGKSTLMKVLYGQLQPDEGTLEIEGTLRRFAHSRDAIAAQIGMVSQHYSIIPELTCLENLMLGAEPGAWLEPRSATERASTLADRMGFRFDWNEPASKLSTAAAQKLEILKLLWRESRLMILDEPTAMLSPADSDALYASLHRLAAEGATVIVVTHRLPEVMDHCRDVTVLRGGKRVSSFPVAETDPRQLSEAIIGRSMIETQVEVRVGREPMLVMRDLRIQGDRGQEAVKGATGELRVGEVVGLAGVDGSGQHELFQAITGHAKILGGTLDFLGQSILVASPRQILEMGVRLIPEDRHAEGVVEDWTLEENSSLGLHRLAPFAQGSRVNIRARSEETQKMIDRFQTKCRDRYSLMRSLSGGNQQRFVAARALAHQPKLVLAFQPTRGLDIEGTRQVYAALRDQAQAGSSVLVVSFDLDELLIHCDRILVMEHGRLLEPPADLARDRQAIGALMVGAA
ncbi:MAG TPA: ATP-binding cassette domain-containing protein [Fimbriimonadaceae bacterium]|nr:ATP-binding cassette domain-containing protein [Fimbriimonadaceae bacterium]HRJ32673.1 ATP-binding cassette domain-containing protein [Fimbriimonadaceae bacterium]